MKRLLCIVTSVVLVAISLCGCNTQKNTTSDKRYQKNLDSFCEELNSQRAKELSEPLNHSMDEYGIIAKDDQEDLTKSEVEELVKQHSFKNNITYDEAVEDVNVLMRILKSSYAGYTYFGGDEKFKKAQEQIMLRVKETYGSGANLAGHLINILIEELSFVEDSHLLISGKHVNFKELYIYFDMNNTDFYQDKSGYYSLINDKKWYLASEDEQYIHMTVNSKGELVYGLFAMAEDETQLPKELKLHAKKDKEYTLTVEWALTDVGQPKNSNLHNYYELDGVCITSLLGMGIDPQGLADTNAFINEAKELRDKKVFVLDLRGNKGGLVYINEFFMYNLIGKQCKFKQQTSKRYSLLNQYHDTVISKYLGNGNNSFPGVDFYTENKELVDSWMMENTDKGNVTNGETVIQEEKNIEMNHYNNKIIVLVDKNTVSAGEYFLYQLATVENVVIMGTNSNGELLTGDVNALSNVYLPNSGIIINYGQELLLTDKSEGFDSKGWIPDIITRGDALEAAINLIKQYQK